jgi:hypothetical protein
VQFEFGLQRGVALPPIQTWKWPGSVTQLHVAVVERQVVAVQAES